MEKRTEARPYDIFGVVGSWEVVEKGFEEAAGGEGAGPDFAGVAEEPGVAPGGDFFVEGGLRIRKLAF